MMDMLNKIREAEASVNPFSSLFTPENMMKLQNHPKIREYMAQPDFMQMLSMMGQNPQMMQMFMQDPRMQEVMGVLLGIDMSQMGGMAGAGMPGTGGPPGGSPFGGPPGAPPTASQPPPAQHTPPPQPAASKPAEPAKSSKFESPE